jgi:5-bromo-4-chloroindolyl phosphate hydrolysis protein/uncharacterized membrane protein YuzA (DUF378 family)
MGAELSKSKIFNAMMIGVLQILAGCLFVSFCGVIALVQLLRVMIGTASVQSTLAYFLIGCAGGVLLIVLAIKNFILVSQAKKLVRTAESRQRTNLNTLALKLGLDHNEAVRNIKRIIQKGLLPTAVLDLKNDNLFFSDLWEGPRIVLKAAKEKPAPMPKQINTGNKELDEMLTAGHEYITQMNELSMKIVNRGILDQIAEIMNITGQIFAFIQKNPDKIRQIRQFAGYYLPTTIKLLSDYEEMGRQTFKGENLTEAMKKIENVMEKIKQTFQNELDHLFSDKAMDISVDIDVMEQMMRDEDLGSISKMR